MADNQIGLGTAGVPSMVGLKQVTLNPTGMTGYSSTATQKYGLAVNRPAYIDLPDMLAVFGIFAPNYTTASNNKPKYKVQIDQGTGAFFNVADLSKTWQELGVQEGMTIKLVDAP